MGWSKPIDGVERFHVYEASIDEDLWIHPVGSCTSSVKCFL